jgi:hypothetical protein
VLRRGVLAEREQAGHQQRPNTSNAIAKQVSGNGLRLDGLNSIVTRLAISSRNTRPSRIVIIIHEAAAAGIVPMIVSSNCFSSGGGILKSPSIALLQKP